MDLMAKVVFWHSAKYMDSNEASKRIEELKVELSVSVRMIGLKVCHSKLDHKWKDLPCRIYSSSLYFNADLFSNLLS
jgi:hypothetical protein